MWFIIIMSFMYCIILFMVVLLYYRKPCITFIRPIKTDIVIPRIIYQTYHSKTKIPNKVFENLSKFCPNYELRLYDDTECSMFIKRHFSPDVSYAFDNLKMGAHRADLFRYCVLYITGGIYIDIKVEPLCELSKLYRDTSNKAVIYSVIGNDKQSIFQGIIFTPPRQPIFLRLIQNILENIEQASTNYMIFVQFMYKLITDDVSSCISSGKILNGRHNDYYLFSERCTQNHYDCYDGLDRYGLCCHVYDGPVNIFKTRYSDYPWS